MAPGQEAKGDTLGMAFSIKQDKIFRRKRTGAIFVHVYIEIWDKGILKFNKFSV